MPPDSYKGFTKVSTLPFYANWFYHTVIEKHQRKTHDWRLFRILFETFDICKPLLLYFYAVAIIQNKNLIHSREESLKSFVSATTSQWYTALALWRVLNVEKDSLSLFPLWLHSMYVKTWPKLPNEGFPTNI